MSGSKMSAQITALLICIMSFFMIGQLQGQSRSSKKSTEITSRLWYGGGLGLGFQSFNQQSSFLFALFPMAGYKITESVSIGPRIGISYQYLKTRGLDGRVYKFNPIEISGALFSRAKVFQQFFAHVEYELANEKRPVYDSFGIPVITSSLENNFYIGAGYNSGGKFASEIYILYNVLEDESSLDVPFVFRGGVTYNF
ncbi:MAG: hypothetical protein HKN76_02930 [Saprospiraceae bacterium]|nr:hypothetical protein [Saprospiraceae bacterium]